jgi:putative phosphoribosyl transferase
MDGRYADRAEAGRVLAEKLKPLAGRPELVVLALPRGGVPVGYEIARRLGAPLDVFVVRKLGVPGHEELAMGALASGGVRVLNEQLIGELGIPDRIIEAATLREQNELERRERAYRGTRPAPDLRGKTVVLVDDGLATGNTMRAAVEAVRAQGPARVIVAVPVAARVSCEELAEIADEVICGRTPEPFRAVGLWYDDFEQISDAEVGAILSQAQDRADAARAAATSEGVTVRIDAGGVPLEGDLVLPSGARGLVLFAHGSGSSRFSPRNRAVAAALRAAGLGTLLVDLLTHDEERVDARTGHLRFDIRLLATRLVACADWLARGGRTADLRIGCFGASTGAAAALVAAAARPRSLAAVVSRGGRPDLAGPALTQVRAPTLLVVGSEDDEVLELNRQALEKLPAQKALVVIPGATHLFEEPGALEQVADLARRWFLRWLAAEALPSAAPPI